MPSPAPALALDFFSSAKPFPRFWDLLGQLPWLGFLGHLVLLGLAFPRLSRILFLFLVPSQPSADIRNYQVGKFCPLAFDLASGLAFGLAFGLD